MDEHEYVGTDTNVLKAQLRVAASRQDVAAENVRRLVCALVDKMKADGAPPEKVVIEVKMAFLGGATMRAANNQNQLRDRERFLAEAVSWCIQQYYDEHASATRSEAKD